MTVASLLYNPEQPAAGTIPTVRLPLSKSIAARLLILNFISGGDLNIGNHESDDIANLAQALMELRKGLETSSPVSVNLGAGATPLRFFIALAASLPGCEVEVRCDKQLQRRPLAPLITSLRDAGADIQCLGHEGYPPLLIRGTILKGGKSYIPASVSSQYASALLLTSPLRDSPLDIILSSDKEATVSTPYLEMTVSLMHKAGINATFTPTGFHIDTVEISEINKLTPASIEPDWSAASYIYEFALLANRQNIRIEKLTPPLSTLQGDSECCNIFALLGVETAFNPDGSALLSVNPEIREHLKNSPFELDLNMSKWPDIVPSLCVGLCLAGIKFRFFGIHHLKAKECDRLEAIGNELEKLGFMPTVNADSISWDGHTLPFDSGETINPYADHRIAMAFAIAAVRRKYIGIEDPFTVNKSFPGFWRELENLGISCHFVHPARNNCTF